jgi:hypothetical protein
MKRQVFFENWQEKLFETIELVDSLISRNPSQTPETDALVIERQQLGELLCQVRDIAPTDRKVLKSYIAYASVQAAIGFSDDFLQLLNEVFEIYRRFRTRLVWKVEEG